MSELAADLDESTASLAGENTVEPISDQFHLPGSSHPHTSPDAKVLGLVATLCEEMDRLAIRYCHWKSNDVLERSATGENDLDLLVSGKDAHLFHETLYRLGFKEVRDPPHQYIAGIRSFYGCDPETQTLVHVHAHYRMVVGHDMNKNYWLPLEQPYLRSTTRSGMFQVPGSELELIVFVIRMMIKHSTWDTVLSREGRLSKGERHELAYLQCRVRRDAIPRTLGEHLPVVDPACFERCESALEPKTSWWKRMRAGYELQRRLKPYSRRSPLTDIALKLGRRAYRAIRRRTGWQLAKSRLASGGMMVAVVGGDGAGKTSTLDRTQQWLSSDFDVARIHFGKPRWSWTTTIVRLVLKCGSLLRLYPDARSFRGTLDRKSMLSSGYPWLLREVCRARDRYRVYLRARRLASQGRFVLLDRFPLKKIKLMDGPQTQRFVDELAARGTSGWLAPHPGSSLTKALITLEEKYYRSIATPELTIVLRVPPDLAVVRKPEEEPHFVHERSSEIWDCSWHDTDVRVIDAEQSHDHVLSEVKSLVWSQI